MAITVQMRTEVSQLYVALFGRAPDGEGLGFWVNKLAGGTSLVEVANTMYAVPAARAYYPSFMTNQEIIASFYVNVLGRTADAEGLAFWTGKLNAAGATTGSVITEMIRVVVNYTGTDPAGITSAALFNNKAKVAQWYGEQNGNIAGATDILSTVTSNPATADAVIAGGVPQSGQTFTLTAGLDTLVGTNGNDVFNGILDEDGTPSTSTLTALDSIDGGAGTDTLNIVVLSDSDQPGGLTIKNVENATLRSAGDATLNTTAWAGLTSLKATQATTVNLTAAATTAVTVSGATGDIAVDGGSTTTISTAAAGADVSVGDATVGSGAVTITHTALGTGEIYVDGGTNVSITASGVDEGWIAVGQGSAATDLPSGVITVSSTSAASNGTAGLGMAGIDVAGGSSVVVTQAVTAGATVAATANAGHPVYQGDVYVTGGAATTSVTVNQAAAAAGATAVAAVAGVKQVDTVTFIALTAGESVTVGGLIFTASKALTAAEVAAAFANLSPTFVHGFAPAGNGVYSGTLAGYSTGAVTTAAGVSTVAATAAVAATPAGSAAIPIVVSDVAVANIAAVNKTAGQTATAAVTGALAIVGGEVDIDGNITGADVLTTVSLNGYGDDSQVASDALTTLTLANSTEDLTVYNAVATTLALSLNNIGTGSTLDLGNAYTTLNVTADGKNSDVTLTANGVQALTVAGTKSVDLSGASLAALKTVTVSGAAGLTIDASGTTVTAVNTAATTGAVTATVDASKATYTGGAGVDNVTLSSATVSKAVNTGAGDDKVTLLAGTTTLAANVAGGDGTDTLVMAAADAASVSTANVFETKIDGFEKLSVGAASGAVSVDLANVDDISYVVSANQATAVTAPTALGVAITQGVDTVSTESAVVTVSALVAGQSYTIAGRTVTASGAATAAQVAGAFATGTSAGNLTVSGTLSSSWSVNSLGADTVGFLSTAPLLNVTDIATSASAPVAGGTLALTNMANNGTLELTGAGNGATVTMTDATGTADSFNIVTKVGATDLNFGTVAVAGVETVNITATDVAPTNLLTGAPTINGAALTVSDAAVKAIVVTGNSALSLTAAGSALTSVNASALTGSLGFASAVNGAVVTGGSGNDVLGVTGNGQTLNGGAGNDVLAAKGDLATLTGGAGNDVFMVGYLAEADFAPSNVNSYATITDLTKGDLIRFSGDAADFLSAKVTLADTAVFQDYANAAITGSDDGDVVWFQYNGNTYVIENVSNDASQFVNNTDVIVKVAGLVDLSTASFSASNDTLLVL